jgi:hypothetical protein
VSLSWALAFQIVGLGLVVGNVIMFYFQLVLMRRQVSVAHAAISEQQRVSGDQIRAMTRQSQGQTCSRSSRFLNEQTT